MINRYLRVETDCILARAANDNKRFKTCDALIDEAFEHYVFIGACGTDACPFYKRREIKAKCSK